jgi:hypothetical protein
MSDYENGKRTPEEAAAISKEFLETIGTMMLRMEMHPRMAIHLFGLFANRLVENEESRGEDRNEMVMRTLNDFMVGLGIGNSVIKRVEGEEAAQLIAEIERETGGHPVQ